MLVEARSCEASPPSCPAQVLWPTSFEIFLDGFPANAVPRRQGLRS